MVSMRIFLLNLTLFATASLGAIVVEESSTKFHLIWQEKDEVFQQPCGELRPKVLGAVLSRTVEACAELSQLPPVRLSASVYARNLHGIHLIPYEMASQEPLKIAALQSERELRTLPEGSTSNAETDALFHKLMHIQNEYLDFLVEGEKLIDADSPFEADVVQSAFQPVFSDGKIAVHWSTPSPKSHLHLACAPFWTAASFETVSRLRNPALYKAWTTEQKTPGVWSWTKETSFYWQPFPRNLPGTQIYKIDDKYTAPVECFRAHSPEEWDELKLEPPSEELAALAKQYGVSEYTIVRQIMADPKLAKLMGRQLLWRQPLGTELVNSARPLLEPLIPPPEAPTAPKIAKVEPVPESNPFPKRKKITIHADDSVGSNELIMLKPADIRALVYTKYPHANEAEMQQALADFTAQNPAWRWSEANQVFVKGSARLEGIYADRRR